MIALNNVDDVADNYIVAEHAAEHAPLRFTALRGKPTVLQGKPTVRREPGSPPGPFEVMQTELRVIVQDDVVTSHPAFPELVERYGVRAQMLAPIVRDDRLVGILSVLYAPGPRAWTAENRRRPRAGGRAGTERDRLRTGFRKTSSASVDVASDAFTLYTPRSQPAPELARG